MGKRLLGESGFTLIEVIIIVAIIGVVASISMIGMDAIYRQQLTSTKTQLLTDLKKLRVDALSVSSKCTNPPHNPIHSYSHTRGFGLRFTSANNYELFEFSDYDDSFSYKADHTEATGTSTRSLGNNITVTLGTSGSVTNNIRIYDNRGILRTETWDTVGNQFYVIHHPKFSQSKCIAIDTVMIREGVWNASTSECE